jgi:hypothetical protein
LYRKRKTDVQARNNESFIDEEQIMFSEEEISEINNDIKANLECAIEGSKI